MMIKDTWATCKHYTLFSVGVILTPLCVVYSSQCYILCSWAMCFTKEHIHNHLEVVPLSMGIIRGIEVRSGRMHLIKDASNKSFTEFDHFDSLSFCFEIISISNGIGLFLEILEKYMLQTFLCLFVSDWCSFLVFLQYIPRNMHTVLLCFALLWLCNRS